MIVEQVDWNNVFTFYDIVQRLLLRNGLSGSSSDVTRLRVAVDDAYRELPTLHKWRFYNRKLMLRTDASVSITSCTYDHTGGTYERQLTITSAQVWPATAQYGEVQMGDATYQIERRISDTVVTLTTELNPGADGNFTSVAWCRSAYVWPVPIREVREMWRATSLVRLQPASQLEVPRIQKVLRKPGTPLRYALLPSRDRFGSTDVVLIPAPSESEIYEATVTVRPIALRNYEVSGSDAAITSGSTTVTCSGASFSQKLVGTLFRLSPNSSLPRGNHQDDVTREDYVSQAFVRRVISATQLELTEAASETATGRGYSISDVLDVEPATMLNVIEALAMERFAMNADHAKLAESKELTRQALRQAVAAECSANYDQEATPMTPFWLGDQYWRYSRVNPPT